MSGFIERLDGLGGTGEGKPWVVGLERAAFVFLVLMVLAAPHSIAATQTAWITGMFLWLVSVVVRWLNRKEIAAVEKTTPSAQSGRHPSFVRRGALGIALWAFFFWSVVTALTSYAPDISIDKLRGVVVFLIFYFVIYNVRNLRAVYFLAFALIFSCMVNVVWVPVQRLIGRGVEIQGLSPNSPLAKATLKDGDTLLEANGVKLTSPEQLADAVRANEVTRLKFYRPDFELVVEVFRSDLLPGGSAMEQLGFQSRKKSRNWRSRGFYGHYTTYAEVLQLIVSLVLGLLVAFLSARYAPPRRGDAERSRAAAATRSWLDLRSHGVSASLRFNALWVLFFCLAAMCLALLLTVTRASQLAFMISAAVIVLFGLGRKWLLAAAVVGLPLALIGLFFLQQSRHVGFFDPKDDSIRWRQTVWREGFDLWTESPRNFVFGVGMDTIKRYAPEWGLFDNGRLPMGHYHSTPLNLLVERGLPSLVLWLLILGVYARTLWGALRPKSNARPATTGGADWVGRGILLGCLGGTVGFFTSGLVHYNLGDQEVAMVFFLLMGLAVRTVELDVSSPNRQHSEAASQEYRIAA